MHGFTRRYDRHGRPYVATTVRITGDDMIDAWQALCLVEGQRPHKLASTLVASHIRVAQRDKNIRALVETFRAWRQRHARPERRLRLVEGGRR